MSSWKVAQTTVCAGVLAVLSACGGGGGSGSTPGTPASPPPPPPPSNATPTARIETPNGTEADERQVLVLDASTSTDADADTLTFRWTQTSGPAVQIASPQSARTQIIFPQVDQTSDTAFQLTVSDGKATANASQILRVQNINLQPRLAGFNVSTAATLQGRPAAVQFVKRSFDYMPFEDLLALRQTAAGTVEILLRQVDQNGMGPDNTSATDFTSISGLFASVAENLNGDTYVYEYAIASEEDNLVQVFERDDDVPSTRPNISPLTSISVQRPCSIGVGLLQVSPADPALSSALIVGRRSGGIQMFAQGSGSSSPEERRRFDRPANVTSSGSFCDVASIWGINPPTQNSFLSFVVGVDTDSNRIRTFVPSRFVGGTTGPLTEWDFTAIRRGTSTLDVTDSQISANGQASLEVAVLLSASEHDGAHALEIYRWNNTWPNVMPFTMPAGFLSFDLEATLTWDRGRPKAITAMDMDGDFRDDYVILLESAPFLVVYLRDYDTATGTTRGFKGPHYIEVGFDYDAMTPRDTNLYQSTVILTRQESGELVSVSTRRN